jgi:hypothetical protein
MGTVIVIVCMGAGLNLALWGALYRMLDGLPERIFALVRRDRAADEARALKALQDAASARVAAVTFSLSAYEEDLARRSREAAAAAEVRARVAERRATDTTSYVDAASALVSELRTLLQERSHPEAATASASSPRSSRAGMRDSGESGAWLSERPSDAEGERTRVGVLPSREALGLPPAGRDVATQGNGEDGAA